MSSLREKLRTFFTGRASKHDQLLFFVFTLAVLLTGIIVAQVFFPGGYSILKNHISDQGGMKSNPQVYWFFDIIVVITGILLVPSFIWLYRRLLPTMLPLSKFATFAAIVGCAGFMLVGIIPEDFGNMHDYMSE